MSESKLSDNPSLSDLLLNGYTPVLRINANQ
jgi:hypothetical protein